VKISKERKRSLNIILTCNIYLQVENETVSSLGRMCNIFNTAYLLTINKLLLHTNFLHSQTSNNAISQKDSLVILEITETQMKKLIHTLNNRLA
jgi:hypothetical protein